MLNKDFMMTPQPCPACGYKLDAATSLYSEYAPVPGDLTICLKCRTVLCWDPQMRVYIPSREELKRQDIDTLIQLKEISMAIVRMRAAQN